EPVGMASGERVQGSRAMFTRLNTFEAVGGRWLSNIEMWRNVPGRAWLQKPLGRWRPFMILQTSLISSVVCSPTVPVRVLLPDDCWNGGQAARRGAPDLQLSRVLHSSARIRGQSRRQPL